MTTPYIDPNLIFAENAPVQDKPASFQNYDKGWDESRNNDGRPLIPQMNYLTQQADLKNLYIHENGAALPYKEGIAYEENAVVVKDGVLQQWKGGVWKSAIESELANKADKTYVDTVRNESVRFYQTLAEANADISNLAVNQAVQVGEAANGGLYYKATSGATSLTKSPYDPRAQAVLDSKNYVDASFAKNRTDVPNGTNVILLQEVGDYLIAPNVDLVSAPTGRTASREAVLSVSGVGTSNRYRKQEYSESVTGKRWFRIIDTYYGGLVRRDWTDVSLAGQTEIVSSLSYRELCRVVASRVHNANAYTQEARDSGLFKGLVQGEIVYDSVNRKVHTPGNLVVYDALGTMYTVSTPQSAGTTETDFGTHNMFMLYLDKSTLTFYLLSYGTTLTDAQKANYILCAVIRHDTARLTVTSDAVFRIDYAQYGEIISKQYAEVIGAGARTAIGNLPNYNTATHELELRQGTVIKFGNINYLLPAFTSINTYSETELSTAVVIYFNLATDEFIVKKYNTNLTVLERFRFVKIAAIRDGAILGSTAAGRDVCSISMLSQYMIDSVDPFESQIPIPYRSMVRYVTVDDTVRAVNHGGYKSVAPANSLEGYTASKAAGFKYVECDVKFTSDGVPILMHDATVDRTTDGTGAVREMTLAQIKELKIKGYAAYPDCRVPTLEEFLRHCHRLNLHPYMEWSEVDSAPTDADASLIAQIIRRTGMDGKVSLISMRTNKLAAVCKFMPHLRCGFTSSSTPTVARLTAVIGEINAASKGQNEIFYNCSQLTLTQEDVNNCHDAGVGCEAWVVEDPAKVLELASWGVTGVSTDSLNIRQILDA